MRNISGLSGEGPSWLLTLAIHCSIEVYCSETLDPHDLFNSEFTSGELS